MINKDFNIGNRLREIRVNRGLTQRQLAKRAGVPHGQISMIEGNKSSPSVSSLRRILSGIAMTMGDFFEPERLTQSPSQFVFRPEDLFDLTSRLSATGGAAPRGQLTLRQVGDATRHNLQILHEVYAPGADTGDSMLEHESSEGGIVISGEIELTVGNRVHLLRAGDSFIFDSREPHRFRNVSTSPAIVVSACTPPYL